jgi:hypothetical protein
VNAYITLATLWREARKLLSPHTGLSGLHVEFSDFTERRDA